MVDWRNLPWIPILRIVGGSTGATILALGLYYLITQDSNVSDVVNDIYRVIFAILIILAELRLSKVLKWFGFLLSFIGLGFFYVFVGGLALGSEPWAIAMAIISCAVGFMYCFFGCACKDFQEQDKMGEARKELEVEGGPAPAEGVPSSPA